MTNKRLLSIDILRGLGIMVILVIHRIHYHWSGMQSTETLKTHFSGPWMPFIVFVIALLTMAGIFYFMTGIVNAYSMYSRVAKGKSSSTKIMMFGLAGGIWIFLMNYVQRFFFMNGFVAGENGEVPKYPVGLLTGCIQDSANVTFRWSQLTEPGTLSLIGLVVIFVSLVLGILLRDNYQEKINKIHLILLILAILSIGLSPFSKFYLRPIFDIYMEEGHYFKALGIGLICREFGLSPYLGYGFIGAALGISLAHGEDRKTLHRKGLYSAIGLLISGAIMILIFDKTDDFERGAIGTGICMIELGLFIFILKILLKVFDYANEQKIGVRQQKSRGMRRFGMLALTVFIFEPVVAEILKKTIDSIVGTNWNNHLPLVLLFGFFCLLFWHLLLKQWEKVNFAGSLEWFTGRIMLKLIKKKTGKTSFNELRTPYLS
ncbi:MAG: hypothetical protein U9R19_18445 [Bacteroidota bacterium]|nr:hypothetical protein [Bacteroidota bacterium]